MKKSYRLAIIITGAILLLLFSACLQQAESHTSNSKELSEVNPDSPASPPPAPDGDPPPGTSPSDAPSDTPPPAPVGTPSPADPNSPPPGENSTGDEGSDFSVNNNEVRMSLRMKSCDKDYENTVLIPKGTFKMGASPGDTMAKSDELPLHEVYLDSYYIYIREVSNRDFLRFVKETGYFTTAETRGEKKNWREKDFEHRHDAPVTNVTYDDAMAYCKWVGGRLPTEAEWEKAARGPNDTRMFPWGNKMNQNYFNSDMLSFTEYKRVRVGDSIYRTPCRTGMFEDGRSPYDVQDMMGNAWEWCLDWYDMEYYKSSPEKNPRGPNEGKYRVLKGGGMTANPVDFRISNRKYDLPDAVDSTYGFRCVIEAKEEDTEQP